MTSLGTCPCSVTVIITPYVPYTMTCYQLYTYAAEASSTVATDIDVSITWYGDLGGSLQTIVTISNGTACNTDDIFSGAAINCLGENYSYDSVTLSTYSYGSQTYTIGSTVVGGVYPC